MNLDQAARQQVEGHSDDPRTAQWAAVAEVDHNNTAWLAGTVERGGWPRSSEVGADAATATWLSTPTTHLMSSALSTCT